MNKIILVIIFQFLIGCLIFAALTMPQKQSFRLSKPISSEEIKINDDEELNKEFEQFKWKHQKIYNSDEENQKRFLKFKENYQRVQEANKDKTRTFTVGITHFSDLYHHEISKNFQEKKNEALLNSEKFFKYRQQTNGNDQDIEWIARKSINDIEPKFDWRDKSDPVIVGPVYNQGSCGSCWSFSVAQGVEALYAKKSNFFQMFAAQEIMDCVSEENEYCDYCEGGDLYSAYSTLTNMKVCPLNHANQYTGEKTQCSHPCSTEQKFQISDINGEQGKLDDEIMANLLLEQPTSIYQYSEGWDYQHYKGGIYNVQDCSIETVKGRTQPNVDHAIIAVGYNLEEKYLIVKNSWGTEWGENGYARLSLERDYNGFIPTCANFFMAYPTAKTVSLCQSGTYLDKDSNKCEACIQDCVTCQDKSTCTYCKAHYIFDKDLKKCVAYSSKLVLTTIFLLIFLLLL